MKSILISIKPEWVAKILNSEKTIEVRKTAPKCDLPINVYIYCTKDGYLHLENEGYWSYSKNQKYTYERHGKVVAKFTLRKIERVVSCIAKDWGDDPWEMRYSLRLEESDAANLDDELMRKGGFESEWTNPVYEYLGFDFPTCHPGFGKRPDFKEGVVYGYAWHISDLVIFDEPIELKGFRRMVPDNGKHSPCFKCKRFGSGCNSCNLTKAPQSWCYVEENE